LHLDSPIVEWVDRSKVVNYHLPENESSTKPLTEEEQQGAKALKLSPSSATVKCDVESITFDIICDAELEWDIAKSGSWIDRLNIPDSSKKGPRQLTLSFDKNTSKKKDRTGYFYVYYGSYSKTFTLTQLSKEHSEQAGKIPLSVNPTDCVISSLSGTKTFAVDCTVAWKATVNSVTWIALESADNTSFTLRYGENTQATERSATVTVQGKTEETVVVTVSITQSAAGSTTVNFIELSPSSLSFPASGGSRTLTVTSDTDWQVTAPSWITSINPQNSTGNKTVTLQANANTTGSDLEGTITVSGTGAVSKSIDIEQPKQSSGGTWIVSPSSLYYNADGGEQELTITTQSTTTWRVSASDSWISLDKTSGFGSGTVKVTLSNNTSTTDPRNGTVSVLNESTGGITSINISQSKAPSS